MSAQNEYRLWQTTSLTLLRMSIGWHCLHEGIVKIIKVGGWSGYGYMANASGPFAPIFRSMAENPAFLAFSDASVKYLLTICGALLLVGLFTRVSAVLMIGLIAMFYLANPPMGEYSALGMMQPGSEGTYLWVNKNLIEIFALWVVLAFENGRMPGLDVYTRQWLNKIMGKSA